MAFTRVGLVRWYMTKKESRVLKSVKWGWWRLTGWLRRSGMKGIVCFGPVREAERRLLVLCGGNKEQVWRLIMYERRRSPGISRAEAACRALESHRRDNR